MQVTIQLYFNFVVKLILAFAFAFQTPLLMVLLTKFGVTNTVQMKLYRKWAFLGCFLLASVLTPPDIITQVLLGFPLYGLYEFGVVISAWFEDPKQRELIIKRMEAEKEARKRAKDSKKTPKAKSKVVVKKIVLDE
jgi:sec-independent protein translocase protein TatC